MSRLGLMSILWLPGACAPAPPQEIPPAPPASSSPAPVAQGELHVIQVAEVQGGVQVARIQVTEEGFLPRVVQVTVGQPVRLTFIRTLKGTCATEVLSPELGIDQVDLPLDQEVQVEFTPKEVGEFPYGCAMERMIRGHVLVKGEMKATP